MEVTRLVPRRRAAVMISVAALGPVLLTGACTVAVAGPVTRPAAGSVARPAAGRAVRSALSRDGWGEAIRVPGTATLNTGLAGAGIASISCASPGDCTAVGTYATLPGYYHGEVFVASQVRGTWRKAVKVPGMAGLHALGGGIGPVSCPAPGDCVAAGSYSIHPFREQAFVVSQARGTWGKAMAIPGLTTMNTRHNARVDSISCASPGNCTAVGTYMTDEPSVHSFVVSEVNSTWGEAEEAPGTATLDTGGDALTAEVSCTSPGDCTAIGTYDDPAGLQYPFVISQVNGTWDTATQIPGMTAFSKFGAGYGKSVSCVSPGNCVAGGSEGADNGYDVGGGGQPFVATETNPTSADTGHHLRRSRYAASRTPKPADASR